jgi:hypothetical protein
VVWSAAVLRCPLPEGAAAILVRCVLDNPSRADPQVLPTGPVARSTISSDNRICRPINVLACWLVGASGSWMRGWMLAVVPVVE